jgi:para-nitrobenzyl esterase
METYFANFIKTGDPNGSGLATWPTLQSGQIMVIDVNSFAEPEPNHSRYVFIDNLYTQYRLSGR